MIKVTTTLEIDIDLEELGNAYSNEDYLVEEIKDHIIYGLDKLGAEVTFIKCDVEGL